MVATCDEGGTRGRAERGGVHACVAQTCLPYAIERGRRNNAAERARRAEAAVIRHDEEHIWSLLRWYDARRPPRFRLESVVLDHAAEFRIGRWKLFSADRCRRAG